MPQVLARAVYDPPRRRSTISAPRHRGRQLRRHKRAPLTALACARAVAASHTMGTWRAAMLLERWAAVLTIWLARHPCGEMQAVEARAPSPGCALSAGCSLVRMQHREAPTWMCGLGVRQ